MLIFCELFQSLVGSNDQSWGWDLGRNKLYHDSKNNAGITYPALLKADETFIVPDKFLGMYTHGLAMAKDIFHLISNCL